MRLELSKRSDVVIQALQLLAARGGRLKRDELAEPLGTSPDMLAQSIGPLVARGWVASRTGPDGGYEITDAGSRISVYDVVEAVEGVPSDTVCVLRDGGCDPHHPCALHEAWTRARKAMLEELRGSPIVQ